MYTLIVDIGNTNIVFAYFKDDFIVDYFRCESDNNLSYNSLMNLLSYRNFIIFNVFVSSVVPILNNLLSKVIFDLYKIFPYFLKTCDKYKFDFNFFNHSKIKIGIDIFANLISATVYYNFDTILVVDIGTACTLYHVKNKKFLGGIITSGPLINFKAIIQNAFLISNFDLRFFSGFSGFNTEESLTLGTLYQYKYLIEGFYRDACIKWKTNFILFLTGGNSFLISPLLSVKYIHDLFLTIRGIKILGDSLK